MIGRTLGNYRIVDRLGAGGMGEVYRARDDRLERDVAVKVLPPAYAGDPARLERFEREARATGRLNHPNLLTIYDVGLGDGVAFLVTELLEGETLRLRIDRGALPSRRAMELAIQIAVGLAAAHDKGIVHRDLKPENLFVTGDGRIKILDFGLAKVDPEVAADGETVTEAVPTQPGSVMGTIGYMAPEQVRGQAVDHRADIFAFGAILYEMLCGRRAFRSATPADTMSAILKEDPPDLRRQAEVPAALVFLVRRCLEKEASERFDRARDLAFALEAVLAAPLDGADRGAGKAKRSLAVLPFREVGSEDAPEGTNQHLVIGLADAIITELARARSLLVRPTGTVLRYQDQVPDPREVGRELGVDRVLQGQFQRSGSRIRVSVQLVAVEDAVPLWGTKIDSSLADLFGMQDKVSRQVARLLQVELADDGPGRPTARRQQPAGDSYESYLKGRLHLYRETKPDTFAAIQWFERSRDADPRFGLAWAGLADAYSRLAFTFEPKGDWYGRAEVAADRALVLDPELAEARYVRARLRWCPEGGFDHAGALRELAVTLAVRPMLNEACERIGTILFHLGMLEESETWLRRALETDPEDTIALIHLGLCLHYQGREHETLEITQEAGRRSPSAWAVCQTVLCRIHLGELEAAAEALDAGQSQFHEYAFFHSLRALIAARRGEETLALEEIERTGAFEHYGHYHHAQHDVACALAALGRPGAALDWLAEAAANGFPSRAVFLRDPLLASVRGEPRFVELMERLAVEETGYREIYQRLLQPLETTGGELEAAPDSRPQPGSSVAVLPFVDMSPNKDQEYFCEGIAEELINTLARIEGLKVVSRTSAFQFRGVGIDIREIGRRLNVATVLEGSVRKASERLRISAELVGVRDGFQLWSQRFDRELEDVFSIQDEIAEATAAALRGVLTEGDREALTRQHTALFQAYDYYLRGRQYFHRGARGFVVSARRMFQRAIEIDAGYALAHAGIADCCSFLHLYYEANPANLELALEASQRAVDLDPRLAEAHAARGLAQSVDGDYSAARESLRRALELDSGLFEAHYLLARICFASGEMRESARRFEQAARLRPEEFRVPSLLAKVYRVLGRDAEAVTEHRRALALVERFVEASPHDALALALGTCALVEIGETERALDWAARAEAVSDPVLYYVACAYARAGLAQKALQCLEGAEAQGWAHWDWLRHDPDLDALRGEERFLALGRQDSGT